jgi:hypothetical protein
MIISKNFERDQNAKAPISFKKFKHRCFYLNKSHLVKKEDIEAASLIENSNSISFIEAIRLRWHVYLTRDENGDYINFDRKGCRIPLRDFVNEQGLELYLDMEEVIDLRGFEWLMKAT